MVRCRLAILKCSERSTGVERALERNQDLLDVKPIVQAFFLNKGKSLLLFMGEITWFEVGNSIAKGLGRNAMAPGRRFD